MPKASPLFSTFNAGELSPLLDGRTDIAKYKNGCRTVENFIPSVQGPAVRRAGTRFVAEVKNSANRTWLARFEFNVNQAYILEFGDFYLRFYTNHGVLLNGAGTAPYEISTPFAAADLTDATDGTFTLNMVQSGDVIYIAHPNYPTQKLARYGSTNWTMTAVSFTNGPFKDQNTTKTTQVYASATSGSVTLTASASIFQSGHVGSLFYLEPQDLSLIKPWTSGEEFPSTSPPLNAVRRSDGKTYICTTTGTPTAGKVWRTGGDKPIHTYGTQSDGAGANGLTGTNVEKQGLDWQYVDSGYGIVQITGYTSGTVVTGTVVGLSGVLPSSVVGSTNKTFRWAYGSFSSIEAYPSKVTFFRERLTLVKGQQLYFSVAGDFENFAAKNESGQVVADRAIEITISSDEANRVEWLSPTQVLLIGTSGCEFACQENSQNEAFAPANVKLEQQTSEGSRAAMPVRVGYSTLFVQRSGRKLKELAYAFQQNGYVTTDMTVLAEHITIGGITGVTWHKDPYVCLWATRADGVLLGFTYNKEQDVLGWHKHTLGGNGVVESVCVIPAPDKSRDDLWMIVKRTINGTTKRYVEYLEREYRDGDAKADAFYVDCGLSYSGSAVTTLSGLSHLEGQTVQVLANGATHPDCVVSGGSITLQRLTTKAQVGLKYISNLQTMRIEAGAADGTSQGKMKRINKVVLRFLNTLGAKAGPNSSSLDTIQFRSGSDPMDASPPLFTGDKLMEWPDGYNFDGYVYVRQDQPLPLTLVAVMPQVHTFDR
jgi:hypothetical protein